MGPSITPVLTPALLSSRMIFSLCPAVVVRADTTILLSPADKTQVDGFNNIIIEVGI